jgi:hypothetical protein
MNSRNPFSISSSFSKKTYGLGLGGCCLGCGDWRWGEDDVCGRGAGGGFMRVSAALRPRWSRESWSRVRGSAVGREGCEGRAGCVEG